LLHHLLALGQKQLERFRNATPEQRARALRRLEAQAERAEAGGEAP